MRIEAREPGPADTAADRGFSARPDFLPTTSYIGGGLSEPGDNVWTVNPGNNSLTESPNWSTPLPRRGRSW